MWHFQTVRNTGQSVLHLGPSRYLPAPCSHAEGGSHNLHLQNISSKYLVSVHEGLACKILRREQANYKTEEHSTSATSSLRREAASHTNCFISKDDIYFSYSTYICSLWKQNYQTFKLVSCFGPVELNTMLKSETGLPFSFVSENFSPYFCKKSLKGTITPSLLAKHSSTIPRIPFTTETRNDTSAHVCPRCHTLGSTVFTQYKIRPVGGTPSCDSVQISLQVT